MIYYTCTRTCKCRNEDCEYLVPAADMQTGASVIARITTDQCSSRSTARLYKRLPTLRNVHVHCARHTWLAAGGNCDRAPRPGPNGLRRSAVTRGGFLEPREARGGEGLHSLVTGRHAGRGREGWHSASDERPSPARRTAQDGAGAAAGAGAGTGGGLSRGP